MSAAALLERLDSVRQTGPGTWRARCPAHKCRSQTLSIRETDEGRVLVHDFGGCAAVDVIAAVGLSMTDLFPARLPEHRYAPSRSAFPAREALALIDHEVLVALLIVGDILAARSVEDQHWHRLAQCAQRIGSARDMSCPARAPREVA